MMGWVHMLIGMNGVRESKESELMAHFDDDDVDDDRFWFGLVSLFNGISTFVGYLMPKSFS